MKLKYILITSMISIVACSTKKEVVHSSEDIYSPPSYRQVYNADEQELDGTWKLVGIDSYSSLNSADGDDAVDDITWRFHEADHKLYTPQPINGNQPSSDNSYQYWSDACLLQIHTKTYIYTIHSIVDETGRSIGRDLTVYENSDSSIADGGSTYRFRSMDTFWGCGVVDSLSNEKPQIVSTIDGIVIQAGTPSPNLKGKWTLTQLVAFASPSDLPNYKDQEVVWNFGTNNKMDVISITKASSEIKNDYSPTAGEHQYWINKCVIRIGNENYSYELLNEGKDEKLVLTVGLSPGIADSNKYILKRI